jgi:hypothetical protein
VWSADGVFDLYTYTTLLSATGAGWASDSLVGLFVRPSDADERWFPVVGNDGDSLSVPGDRSDIALTGAAFELFDPRLSAASACIDAGVFDATVPADIEGVAHAAASGTPAQPAGAPTYPDLGAYEFTP